MARDGTNRTWTARSPRRRAVAATLAGLLALQLVLVMPGGASAFQVGTRPTATIPPPVEHLPNAPGPQATAELHDEKTDSTPMPCGDAGHCGWGLMRCDAAGSCGLPQILPVEQPPFPGTASTSTPRPVGLTAPVTVSPAVELPPPRA